jgi:hypothetical protein
MTIERTTKAVHDAWDMHNAAIARGNRHSINESYLSVLHAERALAIACGDESEDFDRAIAKHLKTCEAYERGYP